MPPRDDYIEVRQRLQDFYARYPTGAVVTDSWGVEDFGTDKKRVWVKALAYRDPDDPHPGVGLSWLEIPGKTPYTNGSELENTETSAWGRAIAAVGIGVSKSIASWEEIASRRDIEQQQQSTPRTSIRDRARSATAEADSAPPPAPATPAAPAADDGPPVATPDKADGGTQAPMVRMSSDQLKKELRARFIPAARAASVAKVMFGPDATLTDEQRAELFEVLVKPEDPEEQEGPHPDVPGN